MPSVPHHQRKRLILRNLPPQYPLKLFREHFLGLNHQEIQEKDDTSSTANGSPTEKDASAPHTDDAKKQQSTEQPQNSTTNGGASPSSGSLSAKVSTFIPTSTHEKAVLRKKRIKTYHLTHSPPQNDSSMPSSYESTSLAAQRPSYATITFHTVHACHQFYDQFHLTKLDWKHANKDRIYTVLIEYAPLQKFPITKGKRNPFCGSIQNDHDYLQWLKEDEKPVEMKTSSEEWQKEEANSLVKTPLIEAMEQRRLNRRSAKKTSKASKSHNKKGSNKKNAAKAPPSPKPHSQKSQRKDQHNKNSHNKDRNNNNKKQQKANKRLDAQNKNRKDQPRPTSASSKQSKSNKPSQNKKQNTNSARHGNEDKKSIRKESKPSVLSMLEEDDLVSVSEESTPQQQDSKGKASSGNSENKKPRSYRSKWYREAQAKKKRSSRGRKSQK